MTLKIMTLNMHKGRSTLGIPRLQRLKDEIKKLSIDILFLQEVASQAKDLPHQFEYLADSIWDHASYGQNAATQKGHHGNAILSKFPILWSQNFDLSVNRLEKRGLLLAQIEHPFKPKKNLFIGNTHLNLFSRDRLKQLEIVSETLTQLTVGHDLVLAGDFNDWDQRLCQVLEKKNQLKDCGKIRLGKLPRTFPSFWPLLALDRSYVRGLHPIEVTVVRTPAWRQISDHLPIVISLKSD